ncbi:hypothetical protein QQ999_00550 [Pseudomonas fluorescens]
MANSKITSTNTVFDQALNDVEHAIGMYAYSYCTMPAEAIYEKNLLQPMMDVIETCHIYCIGYTPIVDFISASQTGDQLTINLSVLNKKYPITYLIPGLTLKIEDGLNFLENSIEERFWPDIEKMQTRLNNEFKAVTFNVKYIGQAYGQDGSRNAIDRLLKHETLQKIALKGVPLGYRLTLLLLCTQPSTQLVTQLNPFAKNGDSGNVRIQQGIDKASTTTEAEKISLYEAALIRYFYPEFNKEFKDSFPSTNLKILQDCYDKDFSAVVAEIHIDELPFILFSNKIKPKSYHIAKYNLHKNEDRKMFFGL